MNKILPNRINLILLTLILTVLALIYHAPFIEGQPLFFKMFYLHLPLAWTTFLAISVGLLYNLGFLRKRKTNAALNADHSMNIAFLFSSLVIASGMVWGKLAWGVWWTWDARLTTTLLLWMMLGAYKLIPYLMDDQDSVYLFRAIVSVFCFLNVPLIHLSVSWWRTLHPQAIVLSRQGLGVGLSPEILAYILGNLFLMTLIYVCLMIKARQS